MKRLLSLLLALMMVLSMVACGDKKEEESGAQDSGATEEEAAGEESEGTPEEDTYTFRSTTTSVSTWNPTDWEFSSEGNLISYTTSPLYSFNMNEAKDGYVIEPEVAVGEPVDVTAEYAGNETYGVPADATEAYAYKVQIRDDVYWNDGDQVTVDDYIYSISQYLNPEMLNFRASAWYSGSGALANAEAYFKGGKSNAFDGENYVEADEYFWSMSVANALQGASIDADYASYGDYYLREDGSDIYTDIQALVESTYTTVNDESKALLQEIATWVYGEEDENAWKKLCFVAGEPVTMDEVGIIKNSDFEMTFVFAQQVNLFNFYYGPCAQYLLHEGQYEANKTNASGIIKSAYNTSVESSASFGPYVITEYQEGKIVKLEKNESWFGYTDGNHEGMYQTTHIELHQIDEPTTQLNLFLQGNLDEYTLSAEDMTTYGTSDYIYYLPESYTYYYYLDSDFDALKAEEVEGENRTILSYIDFRKAVSMAVDRSDYVKKCTASSDPGFGLLNYLYICDTDTGALYRDSEQGQQVLRNIYGVENLDDLTGYDKEGAGKLMQAAYDQCLADGNIKETDKVFLEFHTKGSDQTYVKMVDFLQNALNEAAMGTSLEGRIEIQLLEDPDYYDNMLTGAVDIALCSWGGADLDPYSLMECYCDPAMKGEYGYDPFTDMATINVNGEEITMCTYDWTSELLYGAYANADVDTRNTVLAGIEEARLDNWDVVPVYARTSAFLNSHRIVPGSPEFVNSVVQFGGIQYMTYTMNDAEWAAYCEENGNQLTY